MNIIGSIDINCSCVIVPSMGMSRSLSYFLQHSGAVLPELEHGVVTLERRDGGDVDLMAHAHRTALETVLRMLAEVATHGPQGAASVLPWLRFLTQQQRDECLPDLTETARAAVDSGRLDRLEQTLHAWRATGLAAWDEQVARERNVPTDELRQADAPVELARPRRGKGRTAVRGVPG